MASLSQKDRLHRAKMLARYKSAKQRQLNEVDGYAVGKGGDGYDRDDHDNGDDDDDDDDDDENNSNLSPNKTKLTAAIATASPD